MRVLVYTALCGPKSQVPVPAWRHLSTGEPVEYVCFTDQPEDAIPRPWQVRPVYPIHVDPARVAKQYKVLPHRHLPPHDVSIWVDANFEVTRGFEELLGPGRAPMQCFRHFERDCLYDEAAVCQAMGLDAPAVIDAQMADYRAAGFPAHYGLAECGTLIRRPTPAVARLMDYWWGEIVRGSRRDQLSFMYAVWRCGLRDQVAISERTARDGWHHVWHPHREMGPLLRV
jgi:hypothetical protein